MAIHVHTSIILPLQFISHLFPELSDWHVFHPNHLQSAGMETNSEHPRNHRPCSTAASDSSPKSISTEEVVDFPSLLQRRWHRGRQLRQPPRNSAAPCPFLSAPPWSCSSRLVSEPWKFLRRNRGHSQSGVTRSAGCDLGVFKMKLQF